MIVPLLAYQHKKCDEAFQKREEKKNSAINVRCKSEAEVRGGWEVILPQRPRYLKSLSIIFFLSLSFHRIFIYVLGVYYNVFYIFFSINYMNMFRNFYSHFCVVYMVKWIFTSSQCDRNYYITTTKNSL